MAKRARFSDHSPRVSKPDRSNIDALLESLFAESDLIDASIDNLVESRSTDSDQNAIIQRAIHLGSVLLEAGKRYDRKRSSVHNASVWPLPPDITIKVFCMLDTPSVCSAAATCSFFQNCAKDPLCYTNIDLATLVLKVNDAVVSTMIRRAGNALQSIKLGSIRDCDDASGSPMDDKQSPILTSSCLRSLSSNGGAPGSRLRRLHLYNIETVDNIALLASLSSCPSLIDIEIVRLDVDVSPTLESVSRYCRLIERFIFETVADRDDMLDKSACKEFVRNCPKVTTLALKACGVGDFNARMVVKGFQELKYVDFTDSACFIGAFLKNLGTKGGANNLEVMILHYTVDLKVSAVKRFMEALLAGEFRLLRHFDISYTEELAKFLRSSSILIKQLLEQRPNLCFVAEVHPIDRFDESPITSTTDSSSSTSVSSYNSVSSENSEENNSVSYEESSDEMDDLPI